MRTARPLFSRIDEKLTPAGDCLLWTGRTEGHDYPVIKLDGRRMPVRPIQWERHRGPLPVSKLVTRPKIEMSCGNRTCLNPAHMKVRTDTERQYTLARQEVFRRNSALAKRNPKYRYMMTPQVIDRMARQMVADQQPVETTPEMQVEVLAILDQVRWRTG